VPGVDVHGEAGSGEKIRVDRGSWVIFVHYDAQKSPASPNPPRKEVAITVLVSE
jgi:hypothetical protein